MIRKFWQGQKGHSQTKTNAPSFRTIFSQAQRLERRASLKQKYPDGKFCVIVVEGLTDLPITTKLPKPYLLMGLQRNMNIFYLIGYVKKALNISERTTLFVESSRGDVVSVSTTMAELNEHCEPDGFIYLKIKTEDVF